MKIKKDDRKQAVLALFAFSAGQFMPWIEPVQGISLALIGLGVAIALYIEVV